MDELKPNSDRYKEEQAKDATTAKKVERVVTGSVRTKPKSGLVKLSDIFLAGDIEMVKEHLFNELFAPRFKQFVYDAINTAAELFIFGEVSKNKPNIPASKIEYRSFYDNKPTASRETATVSKNVYDYDNISFRDKADAVEVILKMDALIKRYGWVSVADYKEMSGVKVVSTDHNYGWNNVSSAEPVRQRDGWYGIKLPRAFPFE